MGRGPIERAAHVLELSFGIKLQVRTNRTCHHAIAFAFAFCMNGYVRVASQKDSCNVD
jgi:hypothetical protein